MPFGTPAKVNVTFVESDDCSSVVVNVASCPTLCVKQSLEKYHINMHTRRPCRAIQRPCLNNLLAWRERDVFALDSSSKERVRGIRLGDRLKVPNIRFRRISFNIDRRTSAGARVHNGMRCALVSNPNRSSAAAMNVASLTTWDVLRAGFFEATGSAGVGADDGAGPDASTDTDV